jgi:hypothetical protein
MIDAVAEPKGKFWEGVETAGDYYDIIGGAICGTFVVVGLISVVAYRPWRRRIDRKRAIQQQGEQIEVDEEEAPESGHAESYVVSQFDNKSSGGPSGQPAKAGQRAGDSKDKGNTTEIEVQARRDLDNDEIRSFQNRHYDNTK